MFTYIVDYEKPEEISKHIHNRYFNRYIYQHFTKKFLRYFDCLMKLEWRYYFIKETRSVTKNIFQKKKKKRFFLNYL